MAWEIVLLLGYRILFLGFGILVLFIWWSRRGCRRLSRGWLQRLLRGLDICIRSWLRQSDRRYLGWFYRGFVRLSSRGSCYFHSFSNFLDWYYSHSHLKHPSDKHVHLSTSSRIHNKTHNHIYKLYDYMLIFFIQ